MTAFLVKSGVLGRLIDGPSSGAMWGPVQLAVAC